MEVTREQIEGESSRIANHQAAQGNATTASASSSSWREEYEAYLAEKYAKEKQQQQQQQAADTPSASIASPKDNQDASKQVESEEESWLLQYAKYCAEKEADLVKEDAEYRERTRRHHD
jgi:hypothetical protein